MSYVSFLPGGFDAASLLGNLSDTGAQSSTDSSQSSVDSYELPVNSLSDSPFSTSDSSSPIPDITSLLPPPPPPPPSYSVQDLTSGQTNSGYGSAVAQITPDNLAINMEADNAFIVSGTGNDILHTQGGGTNVLDDTGGSVNFELGSTAGGNAFFLDATSTSVSWNTIANMHSGDFAAIYGLRPQDLIGNAHDNMGVPGYTGLTFETFQNGGAAFVTLAGHSAAELGSSIATAFGTDPAGRPYMLIAAH